MLKGDSDEQNENLEVWQIVSVSSELIEIDLNFVKPLEVSQGEAKDRLIVQVSLHQFPDENNNRLPISVNRIKEIPLQFSSKSEAEKVENMKNAVYDITTGTCAAQFISGLVLKTSMNQVFSLLNLQQFMVYLPLVEGHKFPANASSMLSKMIEFAEFDLIPTEYLDELMYYWPEEDPFSTNFESVGIETTFFLENVGFAIWMAIFNMLLILFHAAIYRVKCKSLCCLKFKEKLSSYLYWNG